MRSRSWYSRLALLAVTPLLVVLALALSSPQREEPSELTTYVLPNKYDQSVEKMQEELQRDSLLPAGVIGAAHHVLSSIGGRLATLLTGLGSTEEQREVKKISVGKLDHLLDEVEDGTISVQEVKARLDYLKESEKSIRAQTTELMAKLHQRLVELAQQNDEGFLDLTASPTCLDRAEKVVLKGLRGCLEGMGSRVRGAREVTWGNWDLLDLLDRRGSGARKGQLESQEQEDTKGPLVLLELKVRSSMPVNE
ncbi:hypothetical protein GUITHDRAFT_114264 [Guillardia theta CCMP2712]|uniref:EF-hand domain-containing protein n=1 Tax=Guillardia theta (strain CCMP2712) TaxID=905079 RepID=L1IUL5_GUITC|nr:hypothetical protein GUITHDRAFT_114264 [Guillardia theta CCMP2712]EKX39767.1 hypothetical protein GUITHDRAFT_114264 [Guillardia theta CCMP2712]|eukprot:XP_005826747.1 hypothetical protein GUITHDRAFT_114264 [Guillardia theta CCMP2712]